MSALINKTSKPNNVLSRFIAPALSALLLATGCRKNDTAGRPPAIAADVIPAVPAAEPPRLGDVRKTFTTHLVKSVQDGSPVDVPPPGPIKLVEYASPAGSFPAYVTGDPGDGKKHPAIVWIHGGDCNSIGEVWRPDPRSNDQSASGYRKAGIVTMWPSLRGGNTNPGSQEQDYGEVDDVLAAADYLASLPYVDPARIYLGGHSCGGTLALLTAECSDRFRDVFCFGPAESIADYDTDTVPRAFDPGRPEEIRLRSPSLWLTSIRTPTFVFEGANQGNGDGLLAMQRNPRKSKAVHFNLIQGKTHFTLLAPANDVIARKIVADTGATTGIFFSDADLSKMTQP